MFFIKLQFAMKFVYTALFVATVCSMEDRSETKKTITKSSFISPTCKQNEFSI